MKAKKPVKMLKCPICKNGDFHYDHASADTYKCLSCGFMIKG